ncbi:MAG: hypothetical protein HKN16_05155 [Saprospiraceae bacterium]|nr:hypothetical protein [Saprospiraceae bacterium]
MVYVMNVSYFRSKDGGKSFDRYRSQHSDHHDLWIAPEDSRRMIIADDGGAQVSFDGGENWSTYMNQPTAQFYRVTTDNHFPYRIYVAQQDNSTLRIPHRTSGRSIGERDWEPTAGGESAHLAVDPEDPEIVYGGSYDGFLTRVDHRNQLFRAINVWPDNPMGHGAEGMKYRFQWNFPIFFSPHDPDKLYTASNHLHVTTNEGQSWKTISPDLTRNDSTKLGPSGGPITKDNTSVEYYCTIFAAAESPRVKDLLWVGSDDGLVHISQDGGGSWEDVTPGWPEWMMVNCIEPDPFNDGGCYVAGTRYKLGDFKPYLYKTKDYGKTWTQINSGIPDEHFTRAIRCDQEMEGLLYAGTETGMYYSANDGRSWEALQMNLPIVPITDLAVKQNNLIAATQGRSVWLIDDLNPIREAAQGKINQEMHLFQPKDSYRMRGGAGRASKTSGENHPGGVMAYFYLDKVDKEAEEEITLQFLTAKGESIRKFGTKAEEKANKLKVEEGSNRFVWNMRYPDAEKFEGMVLWWGSTSGPLALPGEYQVELCEGDDCQTQSFTILKDPRSPSSDKDFQEQFAFMNSVKEKITEAHSAIQDIKDVRKQMKGFKARLPKDSTYQDVKDVVAQMDSVITKVEEALYQTKNRSNQDPLNFPIRLTNKLAHLNSLTGLGDYPPTEQAKELRDELGAEIDDWLKTFTQAMDEELPALNQLIREQQIDFIRRKVKDEDLIKP